MRRLICMCGGMVLVACGSSNDGPVGGPVAGAADIHCTQTDGGVRAQPINLSSCLPTGADAGALDYGATMYNAEADDDDCKYHVKFTTIPVRQKNNVNFTVTATVKATGVSATGAKVLAEVYLSDTHPAPNTNQKTTEQSGGTYVVGPVQFDAPGQWTVRFHLHDDCSDEPKDSPHGHAAFFIGVP